jgi:ferredoxin
MADSGKSAALVRELLVRELETVSIYADMAARARSPVVRELLERIAREEKHHVAEAVDMLSRLDPRQAAAFAGAGIEVGEKGNQTGEAAVAGEIRFEPAGVATAAGVDESILSAALRAGVPIRHDCGGRGRCGTCRLQIVSGTLTAITEPERLHLGDLLGQRWRLACQARPLGEVHVAVPPLDWDSKPTT